MDLEGLRAVVVGGTSGIGHGLAEALARRGASVIIVGRSEERGAAVVTACEMASASAGREASHEFVACDCFSLADVRRVVESILVPTSSRPPGTPAVDLLALTQGRASIEGFTPTSEGLDKKMAVHVWSRAAFALALAPTLALSAALAKPNGPPRGRTLTVLSAGVHGRWDAWTRPGYMELRRGFSVSAAANAAGVYNDALVHGLSLAHPSSLYAHAAPGIVSTRWGSDFPAPLRIVTRILMPLFAKHQDHAADFLLAGWLTEGHSGAPPSGVRLLDQHGRASPDWAPGHDARWETLWGRMLAVVGRGGTCDEGHATR